MNRLKDIWGGQDDMNRVLFLIAVAAVRAACRHILFPME